MKKLLVMGILLCIYLVPTVLVSAQSENVQPVCQTYHLTENEASVRTCTGEDCQSIQRILLGAELCVVGVADDNPAWLEVNLAEAGNPPVIGYIENAVLAAGTSTTNPDSALFCNSYEVPENTQVSAHTCPDPDCPVLETLEPGSSLCALQFSYQFVQWTSISDPASGLQAWTPSSTLTYQYDESFGCPDFSYEAVVNTPLRDCPRQGCATVGSLAAGQRVCALEDRSQEFAWFSYPFDGSTEAWVFEPFLRPVTEDDNQENTVEDVQPTATATIQPVGIALEEISIRESAGIGSARLVPVLSAGESAPILGQTQDGNYLVRLSDGREVLLPVTSFQIPGTDATIPFINDQGQLLFTPTPVATTAVIVENEPTAVPSTLSQCQPYVVSVPNAATVRSFPGIQANILTYLAGGDSVCVLGAAPDVINWLELELSPEDTVENLGYISEALVSPVSGSVNTQINNPAPTATQIVLPTQPPQPTAAQVAQIATPVPTVVALPTSAFNIVATPAVPNINQAADGSSPFAPPPTQVVDTSVFGQEVTLEQLFIESIELESPQGNLDIGFSVPEDWKPTDSSILRLDLDYFENVINTTGAEAGIASQLDISLDGRLISSTTFQEDNVGRQILEIPLPTDILANEEQRFHTINIRLNAQDHCEANSRSRVSSDGRRSAIRFAYQEYAPTLDLALYPRPIYNRPLAPEIEQVWMVMPDNPSMADVQSAASIATGLGFLTGDRLVIKTTTAALLPAQERINNHLILIGQPDRNTLTSGLYDRSLLPTSRSTAGVLNANGVEISSTDGIVQIIQHPDNTRRSIVVVTGQTETALMKAAQSLAGPPSAMGLGGTLAVISDTQPIVRLNRDERGNVVPFFTRTFSELGVEDDILLSGIGLQATTINFDVPIGGGITEDAYVDIIFNNSMSIEMTNSSSMTILINEVPVASAVLTARDNIIESGNILEPRRLRARIPADSVNVGESNTMTILVDTRGEWECDIPALESIWVNVSRSSVIHLPQAILQPELDIPLVSHFPAPFNRIPNLSNVMISMPASPTAQDVDTMVRILSRLGNGVEAGEGFTPLVFTDALPTGLELSEQDFIIIGRPTTNSFLALLNDNLPQPFVPGTDELQQVLDDVSYRLLPGFDVGIMETLNSPWNPDKAVFVLTGTSDKGQNSAAKALLDGNFFRFQFEGNVVFASDVSVSALDTRDIVNVLELINEVPVVAQATPFPTETPRPLITVTPAGTITPSPTPTVGPTIPPTSIFTMTPEATLAPPTPTLEPIAPIVPEQMEPVTVERPSWILGLLVVTAISVLASMIYGLFRIISYMRSSRKSDS